MRHLVGFLISRVIQVCEVVGALNWATGETVAVKEITLSNIPKGELSQIMVSVIIFHLLLDLLRCCDGESELS